jgi:hypothetical protein
VVRWNSAFQLSSRLFHASLSWEGGPDFPSDEISFASSCLFLKKGDLYRYPDLYLDFR